MLVTKGRLVAYTSDIGESVRPVVPPWVVTAAYGEQLSNWLAPAASDSAIAANLLTALLQGSLGHMLASMSA